MPLDDLGAQLTNVFISYSSRDKKWKDQFLLHLRLAIHADNIWDDSRLKGGDLWFDEIKQALNRAEIGILLVSVEFLDSDFIRREEVADLLRARQDRGLRIVPIFLRDCVWQNVPWLNERQMLPKIDGTLAPVVEPNIDQAGLDRKWALIAKEIRAIIGQASHPKLTPEQSDLRVNLAYSQIFVRGRESYDNPSKKAAYEKSLVVSDVQAGRDEQQQLHHEIEAVRRADPALAEALRCCSIPRVFNEPVLAALRKTQDGTARLMAELLRYRFVHARNSGGYVYDVGTRAMLLEGWKRDDATKLDELHSTLAEFYWARYAETLDSYQERDLLSSPDPYEWALRDQALVVAPLPEALYHQASRSATAAYEFFEEKFTQCEQDGRLAACDALLTVTRRELETHASESQVDSWLKWLRYWEARLRQAQRRFDASAELLVGLIDEAGDDNRLKVWSLGDLGNVLLEQKKVEEARKRFEEGLALAQVKQVDAYNLPIWYSGIARVSAWLDELQLAITWFRMSTGLARKAQNGDAEADAFIGLSEVLQQAGQWAEAWEACVEALHLVRTQRPPNRVLQRLAASRVMNLMSSRSPDLIDTISAELEALNAIADSRVDIRMDYAGCLLDAGAFQRAEVQLRELTKDPAARGDVTVAKVLQGQSASLRAEQGLTDRAIDAYRAILRSWAADGQAEDDKARVLLDLAQLLAVSNQSDEAKACAEEAEGILSRLGLQKEAAWAAVHVARGLLARDPEAAQKRLDAARNALTGVPRYLSDFHEVQGEVYRRQNRLVEASAQYQLSLALNRSIDRRRAIARNLRCLLEVEEPGSERAIRLADEASDLRRAAAAIDAHRPSENETQADQDNGRGVQSFYKTEGERQDNLLEAKRAFLAAAQKRPCAFWYDLNAAYASGELGQWEEACRAMEASLECGPEWWSVPRLRQQLETYRERHVDALLGAGDDHWRARAHTESRRVFQQALDVLREAPPQDHKNQAAIHARIAMVQWVEGEAVEAGASFAAAVRRGREQGLVDAAKAVGKICGERCRDLADYNALDAAWEALAEHPDTEPSLRRDLVAAQSGLGSFFDNLYKLSDQGEPGPFEPIRLEIGADLIPEDTSTERWTLFTTLIPDLKSRIQLQTGVDVPGIMVIRGQLDGKYAIAINEARVAKGTVLADKRYCPADKQTLLGAGVPEASLIVSPHPITRIPGCWVAKNQWDVVTERGFELWEPLVLVIRHLEGVLRRNLREFIDMPQVRLVFQAPSGADAPSGALPLLRALADERVPITQEIAKAIQDIGVAGPMAQLTSALRRRMKNSLPGNSASARRHELDRDWEDRLVSSMKMSAGGPEMLLGPVETNQFLADLRRSLGPPDPSLVLLVRNTDVRPFVRRLVQVEFPDLMVLAEDERCSVEALAATDSGAQHGAA